jgi:hypothetical protein
VDNLTQMSIQIGIEAHDTNKRGRGGKEERWRILTILLAALDEIDRGHVRAKFQECGEKVCVL